MSIWQRINDIYATCQAMALELSNLQDATYISESNGNFQRMVAYRILQTGKKPEQLTLGELRTIINAARKEYSEEMHPVRHALASN